MAHSAKSALLLRVHLAATSTTRLRRRWNDVRNARFVHLLVQRGKFLISDFLDLHRSIVDQLHQFGELFFLVSAGGGRKTVQVVEKVLNLIRQRIGLPFEWRTCVPQAFPRAEELLCDGIDSFLQLIGSFDDIVRDFRRARFSRILVLLPLLARGLQRCLYAFNCFSVLIRALGHGIELVDHLAARRAVRRRNHDARILFDRDFLRGFLVCSLDLHGVFPRFDEWPARTKAESRGDGLLLFGRRLRQRIEAQIPICAVHAHCRRPIRFPDYFSVLVEYGDFYFAFLLFCVAFRVGLGFLLDRVFLIFFLSVFLWRLRRHRFLPVVAPSRAIWRILCGERFLPSAPTAIAQVPGYCGPRRKEC